MRRNLLSGAAIALASAVTFGLVNVVAKSADLHPLALASVAYLLAGAALSPFLLRARFARRDVPLLLTMSLAGGAVAPVLLFAGLLRTTAVDASFLLTAEILFAIVLARTFLGERVGARAGLGIVLLGGAALAVAAATLERGGNAGGDLLGNALVVAATLAWAIDDVVSTRLAGSYAPPQLSSLKGLVGGGAVLVAALVLSAPLPPPPASWPAIAFVGLVGIAVSTVLFYAALQRIGTSRTIGLFSPTTALAGAFAGFALLAEPLVPSHAAAGALLLAGVWLVASERPPPVVHP